MEGAMTRGSVKAAFTFVLLILLLSLMTEDPRLSQNNSIPPPRMALSLQPERNIPAPKRITFGDCDISRNNCGTVTLGPDKSWIADGAHDTLDETFFFVDVGIDYVFQFDPVTCTVVEGTYYDDANNYPFIGTNTNPDLVYVFDITGGELGSELGVWSVPWQSPTDGWDMAGMGFDDDAGQLVMVNQYGNYSGTVRELFDFSIAGGLTGAGYCDLASTGFGWGIAVVEDGDPPDHVLLVRDRYRRFRIAIRPR
jgi:hypothetical protein